MPLIPEPCKGKSSSTWNQGEQLKIELGIDGPWTFLYSSPDPFLNSILPSCFQHLCTQDFSEHRILS